jgi:hypothetical protein
MFLWNFVENTTLASLLPCELCVKPIREIWADTPKNATSLAGDIAEKKDGNCIVDTR